MKLPLTLILLGTALPAAAQPPLPPAVHGQPVDAIGTAAQGAPLWLVSEDEDDGWLSFGDDDSSGDDCDADDDSSDDDCRGAGAGNAAPAGTVAPPANGLFGDGKAPKASTN